MFHKLKRHIQRKCKYPVRILDSDEFTDCDQESIRGKDYCKSHLCHIPGCKEQVFVKYENIKNGMMHKWSQHCKHHTQTYGFISIEGRSFFDDIPNWA